MTWERGPLWHISGVHPDELVGCVVTGHRDRFGVEVDIVGIPSGHPAFIDAALLRDGGYASQEEFPPVGTLLEAIPVDFMPDGDLRLSARPSDLRHAGEPGDDVRFLPVAQPGSGEAGLAEGLAHAGLVFQGWHTPVVPHIPPELAAAAFDFPRMEGRHRASVEFTDPDLLEETNGGWYRVASDAGLFGEDDPVFLVGVLLEQDDPVARWATVRLTVPWDIMGAGGRHGMLGTAWCRPGFTMLSLDGDVIVRGDTTSTAVYTAGIRTPRHQVRFMDWARSVGGESYFRSKPELRAAVATWLRTLE
jgi:hypothetical protein